MPLQLAFALANLARDQGPDTFSVLALIVSALIVSALSLAVAAATAAGSFWASRRRRAVPPADLAGLLGELDVAFNDITAFGGQPTTYFLQPDQRNLMTRLSVIATHIVDNDLNALVGNALAERHASWVNAGESRQEHQMEAARRGSTAARASIERCGELFRRAAGAAR